MSIELSFTGTAFYVFFILANFARAGATTETLCDFTLDGRAAGSFSHLESANTNLDYNQLVFKRENLTNTPHKLVVSTSGVADRDIYVNFDYAIYTFDDGAPTTTRSSTSTSQTGSPQGIAGESNVSIAVIAGAIAGGVVVVIALIVLIIFLRRRKRRNPRPEGFTIDDDDAPKTVASADGNRPNLAIVPFRIDTSVASSGSEQDTPSDFIQSGTVLSSPYTALPSFLESHNNQTTSPSRTNSDMVDPSLGRTTMYTNNPSASRDSVYGGMESAYGGIASETSSYTHGGAASVARTATNASGRTLDPSREAIRWARQSEIDRKLRAARTEMQHLNSDIRAETRRRQSRQSIRGHEEPEVDAAEVLQMRQQMQAMRERIDYLQAQQQSEWAQGLSDEAPPGYSVHNPNLPRTST
ncbi:hypothetical protein H0H81_012476 [Sphagnurus paluster]|uniref:Uncharacterized protein n=1 Tax=Sphagnurus paluster TaxID=117069 RepID=A0A9P7KM80_9AGAR|nr:hypothetical protein H0H81_012476 [Sphagnurus paluster]